MYSLTQREKRSDYGFLEYVNKVQFKNLLSKNCPSKNFEKQFFYFLKNDSVN